jgi:serine/threonine protein kinase
VLAEGNQIGPYVLVRELGRGSFGQVWLAERRGSLATTHVAVKVPLGAEPDLEALAKEARIWVQASGHPNVLPVIEADVYDGTVVIVSEYAAGGSMSAWLKTQAGDTPPIQKTIDLVTGILAGLGHLHSKGIVHRDLKPGNVLLQGDCPRLTDFGLARVLKADNQSRAAGGTPAYMAPEAWDGHRSEAADLWSGGVILYEMLAGVKPFPQTDLMQLFRAISSRDIPPLPGGTPAHLVWVVRRALEKSPERRYQSTRAMLADLQLPAQGRTPQEFSPQDHPPSPAQDLEIVAVRAARGWWRSRWKLDLTLRNRSAEPAVIDRITITVLEDHALMVRGPIRVSARYGLPIDALQVGQSHTIEVTHALAPHAVDRFTLALHTVRQLLLRVSLHYNRAQKVEARVGVGVEDGDGFISWADLAAMCGPPVYAWCLSREELIQALRERRILQLEGPPWVLTNEQMLAGLNEDRLRARGGLPPDRGLAIFPRALPEDMRIRRHSAPLDVLDVDTPAKVQETRTNERLLDAATAGNLDTVKTALAEGADINFCRQGQPSYRSWWGTVRRENALSLASLNGHLELVHWLLAHGASVANPCGSFAWYCASYHGRKDIASLLEKAGVALELTAGQRQRLRSLEQANKPTAQAENDSPAN